MARRSRRTHALAAHRLKGSAGVFAADQLSAALLELEALGRAGLLESAPAALERTLAEWQRLRALLDTVAGVPSAG